MEMCRYKIDTGSDSNLPINTLRKLFAHMQITDLKKSIDRKIELHAYNNSCIQQMRTCRVTIINKGIEVSCSFFVVPVNGPELSGDAKLRHYNCLV